MIDAMRQSIIRVSASALLFVSASVDAATPRSGAHMSGADSVSPENLNGRELVMPSRNFAIAAPGDQSIWVRSDPRSLEAGIADQFVCWSSKDRFRFTVTVRNLRGSSAEGFAASYIDDVRKKTQASSTKIKTTQKVDTPLLGSMFFALVSTSPVGDASAGVAVVGAFAQYGYVLETQDDSDAFRAFVASFRLLGPAR